MPRYMQALMELISKGEYISWKLPENTHIVLSSNPDSGDYNVTSLDAAQRNRFISYEVKLDIDEWAKWAEEAEVDQRIINFSLFYREIYDNPLESGVTPRSMEIFANAISGLKDLSQLKNMALVNIIADGCFESKENVIGKFFPMFVNNKLDRLIAPKDMLLEDWKIVSKKMEDSIYENGNIRADISSVLTIRFLNYVDVYFKQPKANSEIVIKRVEEIVEHEKELFTVDLIFKLIKTLIKKYPSRTIKLLLNKDVKKAINTTE